MKSGSMLKAFGVCAISFLSLSGGAAQAADSCVLSSLSRAAAAVDGADGSGNAREGGNASARSQSMVATLAPVMGGMAKEGLHTASSVMRALTQEASRLLQD
ncbi:MAG: hypothetical protein PHD37_13275 [Gallionellaceae bacterium]|nr:hypothetical protein [Gallionellaceae bacterium]